MPIRVELPGGAIAEFPDDLKMEEIDAILTKEFGKSQPAPPPIERQPDPVRPPVPAIQLPMGGGFPTPGMNFEYAARVPNNRATLPEFMQANPAMSPEKAKLAYEQEGIALESEQITPAEYAAHGDTGVQQGNQFLPTQAHSAFDIARHLYQTGQKIPGIKQVSEIGEGVQEELGSMLLNPSMNQARKNLMNFIKSPEAEDPYFKELAEWSKKMEDRDRLLGKPNMGTELSKAVGRGVAELPGQMVGGTMGGMPGAIIGSGVSSGLQTYADEKGEGMDWVFALNRGAINGLIDAMTTRKFGATGIESIFRNDGVTGLTDRVRRAFKEGGYEFTEEFVAEFQQDLAERIQKNPDKSILESLKEQLIAGLVGFTLGTSIGAVAETAEGASEAVDKRVEKSMLDAPGMPMVIAPVVEPNPPEAGKSQTATPAASPVIESTPQGDKIKIPPKPAPRKPLTVSEHVRYLSLKSMYDNDILLSEEENKEFKELQARTRAQQVRMITGDDPVGQVLSQQEEAEILVDEVVKDQGIDPNRVEMGMPTPNAAGKVHSPYLGTHVKGSGTIRLNMLAIAQDLAKISPSRRKDFVRSVVTEEWFHSHTSRTDALKFFELASKAERALARRIYTQNWGGFIKVRKLDANGNAMFDAKGKPIYDVEKQTTISDENLGYEIIRRRLQRLEGMTVQEVATRKGFARMESQFLDLVDDLIVRAKQLGVNGKSQRDLLKKLQENVKAGRHANEISTDEDTVDSADSRRSAEDRLGDNNRKYNDQKIAAKFNEFWWMAYEQGGTEDIELYIKEEMKAVQQHQVDTRKALYNIETMIADGTAPKSMERQSFQLPRLLDDLELYYDDLNNLLHDGPMPEVDDGESQPEEGGKSQSDDDVVGARRQYGKPIRKDTKRPNRGIMASNISALQDRIDNITYYHGLGDYLSRDEEIKDTLEEAETIALDLKTSILSIHDLKQKGIGNKQLDGLKEQLEHRLRSVEFLKKRIVERQKQVEPPDEDSMVMSRRSQLSHKQIEKHHKLMDALKHLNKVSVARLNEAVYMQDRNKGAKNFAAINPRPKHNQTLFDTWRQFFSKWQYLSHSDGIELLGEDVWNAMDEFANQWMGSDEQVMQYTDDLLRDLHEADSITGEEDEESYVFARRSGPTKKEIRAAEEQRKYEEAMGEREARKLPKPGPEAGAAPRKVPAKDRLPASAFFPKPTPASISQTAQEVLTDTTQLPSFQRFLGHVRSKHGDIQPGQVTEAWVDAINNYLESAPGEVLNKLIDRLGLRRQVWGKVPQGSKTLGLKGGPPTLERTGDIADPFTDVGGIETARQRGLDRAARMNKAAEKLEIQASATKDRADHARVLKHEKEAKALELQAAELRQKAQIKRGQADAQEAAAHKGEGIKLETASLFGGEEELGPEDYHDPVKGPMRKARDRAIAILGAHLKRSGQPMDDGLSRTELSASDIRWHQQGADIIYVTKEDLQDLDQLGMELTAKAISDTTTRRVRGGGTVVVKQKTLPRSATKRVVAFRDKRNGRVYLVSGYRDQRRGPVFLDPESVTGENRTLQELSSRFEPVASFPLDKPVQNFFKRYENDGDFNTKFLKEVQEMEKEVGYKGYRAQDVPITEAEAEDEVEGTPGLEGEGSFVQGPAAGITRAILGLTRGARDAGIDITQNEARYMYRVFRSIENPREVEQVIERLRQKAEKNELTPADYALISGMSKVKDSLSEEKGFETGVPTETVLNLIYDLTQKASEASFTKSVPATFARELRVPDAPAQVQGRKETGRELTMPIDRVPPTLVRPENVPSYAPKVVRRPAPRSDVFGGGLKRPPADLPSELALNEEAITDYKKIFGKPPNLKSKRGRRHVVQFMQTRPAIGLRTGGRRAEFTPMAEAPPELGPFLPPKQKEKKITFTPEELAEWRKQEEKAKQTQDAVNTEANKVITDVEKAAAAAQGTLPIDMTSKASEAAPLDLGKSQPETKKGRKKVDPNQGKLFALRRNDPQPPPSKHTFSRILASGPDEAGNYQVEPWEITFDELSLLIGWPVDGRRGKGTPGSFEGSHDEDDLVRAVEDGRKPVALFDEVPLYVPPGLKVVDSGSEGYLGRYRLVKEGQEWASDAFDVALASGDHERIGKALGFTNQEINDFKHRSALIEEHSFWGDGLIFTKEEVMNAMARAMENDPDQSSFVFARRNPAPEMDASLKDSITMAWRKRLARNIKNRGKLRNESHEAWNEGMAEYAGVESVDELTNDFDDAIFNFAGTPNDEWDLNSKDKAALLKYFDDAEGTEHDRSLQIKGMISGEEYLANHASSVIAAMEKLRGNFGSIQAQELNNRIAVQRNILKDQLKRIDKLKVMMDRYPETIHAPKPTDELPPHPDTQGELFALRRMSETPGFWKDLNWRPTVRYINDQLFGISQTMDAATPDELSEMKHRLSGLNHTIRSLIRDSGLKLDVDGTPIWDTVMTERFEAASALMESLQIAESIEKKFPESGQDVINELDTAALESERPPSQNVKVTKPRKPKVDPDKGQDQLFALRTNPARTLGHAVRNLMDDTGSIYDRWMVDRLQEYGGRVTRRVAGRFRHIISREKQLYGRLSRLVDRARRLAGGIDPGRNPGMGARAWVRGLPARVPGTFNALRSSRWLNRLRRINRYAATANVVDAIEGNIAIPSYAQDVVDAARAANMEIGLMLEAVIDGFRASGLFQRNLTSVGYDTIRAGGGDIWDRWTQGVADANRLSGATVFGVRDYFTNMKRILDSPALTAHQMEEINQDFARTYPAVVTHVRQFGRWIPVVHSDLFNYIENAARRATHITAFREQFPNTDAGREAFTELMERMTAELPPELQRDLSALVRSLHGHPTDDMNTDLMDVARMTPQQVGGALFRGFNQTVGNLAAKLALSGQMATQTGEVAAGSTQIFLGYDNYMRALHQLGFEDLYELLETNGAVNRVMSDYTMNTNAPFKSLFRITGNVVSKVTMQNMLNEFQEATAAATARVVADRIVNGNLNNWERRFLPHTFSMMGFSDAEIVRMMAGDAEVIGQFQRKAAAWLTGGNKAIAEGSRLSSMRLFNSIFRFQTYPMVKMNQFRRVAVNWADSIRSGDRESIWISSRMLGRFLFGNGVQGGITAAIVSLAYGGMTGLKLKWEESKDHPFKFAAEAMLSAISGPLYLLWRSPKEKGMAGLGEQAARVAFPWAMMNDLSDMSSGNGTYRDKDWPQRVRQFLYNKTPAAKAFKAGLAMSGIAFKDHKLDVTINAMNRWMADEFGYDQVKSYRKIDETKQMRIYVGKALEAMKKGDEEAYIDAWMKAVDAASQDQVLDSLNSRLLLRGPHGAELTEEQTKSLQKFIGMEAYNRLEGFDIMLEAAADGAVPPPMGLAD